MSDRAPFVLMALKDVPGQALAVARGSRMRVVIATDDPEFVESPLTWKEAVDEQAWPRMMEAVERNGWVPQGKWIVIVDDSADWRAAVADAVVARVEEALKWVPNMRVLGVAHLFDAAGVDLYPNGALN